jgi:hypothetical protein
MNYASIGGLAGKENPGGIAQLVYWAPKSDFTTIQEPDSLTAATNPEDAVEVTASHVFVATKFFHTMYCTQGKGKMGFKNASEPDASGGFVELEVFVPGVDAATHGILRKMKMDDLILVVPMADGVKHQLGTSTFPAKMGDFEFGVAENGSGTRGTMVKFRSFYLGIIQYSGSVPTS